MVLAKKGKVKLTPIFSLMKKFFVKKYLGNSNEEDGKFLCHTMKKIFCCSMLLKERFKEQEQEEEWKNMFSIILNMGI